MPAVVMVDRVGVPGVGQCGLRIDVRQQVAGRVVFAQLVPGVERASDAVPGVVGALGHHVELHCGRGGKYSSMLPSRWRRGRIHEPVWTRWGSGSGIRPQ